MVRSGIGPLAVVPRYFDIAVSLRPRTDGETGFLGEVDDAASPLAGVSAAGLDPASTVDELARTAWAVLHEPVIRQAAEVDPDRLAGVRLHLTVLHELAAADLGGPTNSGAGRPTGGSAATHPDRAAAEARWAVPRLGRRPHRARRLVLVPVADGEEPPMTDSHPGLGTGTARGTALMTDAERDRLRAHAHLNSILLHLVRDGAGTGGGPAIELDGPTQRQLVEPLAAIRAALVIRATAAEVLDAQVGRARGAGHSWADLGRVLGLENDAADIGVPLDEAAFNCSTVGDVDDDAGDYPRWVRWTCWSCSQQVTDYGPLCGPPPAGGEDGHADDCARRLAPWVDDPDPETP
jgi:hypothetical protein